MWRVGDTFRTPIAWDSSVTGISISDFRRNGTSTTAPTLTTTPSLPQTRFDVSFVISSGYDKDDVLSVTLAVVTASGTTYKTLPPIKLAALNTGLPTTDAYGFPTNLDVTRIEGTVATAFFNNVTILNVSEVVAVDVNTVLGQDADDYFSTLNIAGVTGNVGGKVLGGGAGVITGIGGWVAGAAGAAVMLGGSYVAPDNTGISTLLTRLSATRAGYLDNLNTGGVVASQADILAINQSASKHVLLATVGQYERPESGTVTYTVECRTFAASTGNPAAASPDPTLTATGSISGTLAIIGAITNPATGVYRWPITVASTATLEQVRFDVSATINGTARTLSCYTQVADFVAATFTTADRTILQAAATEATAQLIKASTDATAARLPGSGTLATAGDVTTSTNTIINAIPTAATVGDAVWEDADATNVKAWATQGLTMLENGAGSNKRFTVAALANAPAGGGGGGGLEGSNAVTLTFTDADDNPLQNVEVTVSGSTAGRTNADGVVTFGANDGTYAVTATLDGSGILFPVTALEVDGDTQLTVTGTAITLPTPTQPDGCVVTFTTRTAGVAAQPNVKVYFSLIATPEDAEGNAQPDNDLLVTSDANGLATVELRQGCTYEYWRGIRPSIDDTRRKTVLIPSTSSTTLPDFIGTDRS